MPLPNVLNHAGSVSRVFSFYVLNNRDFSDARLTDSLKINSFEYFKFTVYDIMCCMNDYSLSITLARQLKYISENYYFRTKHFWIVHLENTQWNIIFDHIILKLVFLNFLQIRVDQINWGSFRTRPFVMLSVVLPALSSWNWVQVHNLCIFTSVSIIWRLFMTYLVSFTG